MHLIPLIHLQNRKIIGITKKTINPQTLQETLNQTQPLYLLDHDGIKKDKPNLCLYKQLSEHHPLWVDGGPRSLGDIVDTVMAGATTITIRKHLWPTYNLSSIKELTDNQLFLYHDPRTKSKDTPNTAPSYLGNGIILFNHDNQLLTDFTLKSIIKTLSTKYPTYIYEPSLQNQKIWKNLNVQGLLIDFGKIKEKNQP
jgi:hypothetical protein